MSVISRNFVLTGAEAELSADHPVIGWRNLVTVGNLDADTEDANYPAANLANVATHLEWRGADDSEQYLTITTGEIEPIDYIAIARHNFGSAQIPVTVEGLIDGDWTALISETLLADDTPAIFRFTAQALSQIRLHLGEGDDIPRLAILYCGKLTVIERRIYAGHTPLPHGRKTKVANGMSESGNFLGRIVLGETRESTVPLSLLRPAWYRANFDDGLNENSQTFIATAQERPFFFAWRPGSYPSEVGFACLTNNPTPAPAGPSNLIALELNLVGVS